MCTFRKKYCIQYCPIWQWITSHLMDDRKTIQQQIKTDLHNGKCHFLLHQCSISLGCHGDKENTMCCVCLSSLVDHFYIWLPLALPGLGYHSQRLRLHQSTQDFHFNTLRSRQNGHHFTDNILKCISLNENIWIYIKTTLKFVPKGPINNIPALFQIMAWHGIGDKPLSGPMLTDLIHRRIYATVGGDELTHWPQGRCGSNFKSIVFKLIIGNNSLGIATWGTGFEITLGVNATKPY